MLAIPDWRQHIGDEAWLNTTLFQVSRATGGEAFSVFFTVGYLTALGVFNVVATAAGARLLFGMGRDELLPRAVFARVNRRWRTPHWSILLICAIEFALGNFANMETLSNLVNYGAMFAFAALNISVVWLYYVRGGGELADGSRLRPRARSTCATCCCPPSGWPSSSTCGRTWTRWPRSSAPSGWPPASPTCWPRRASSSGCLRRSTCDPRSSSPLLSLIVETWHVR